jgi:hypothetical protein
LIRQTRFKTTEQIALLSRDLPDAVSPRDHTTGALDISAIESLKDNQTWGMIMGLGKRFHLARHMFEDGLPFAVSSLDPLQDQTRICCRTVFGNDCTRIAATSW